MEHRISRPGLVFSAVMAAFALASFIFLNLSFEGPSVIRPVFGSQYKLETKIDDTEAIPTKQPVLIHGLSVGKVTATDYDMETQKATIEFSIDDEFAPIYKDATLAVGERTLLGDAYIRLDPGHEEAGALESGDEVRSVASVDFDEAFAFLDEKGRRHLQSIIDELAVATRSERGALQVNDTTGELARTTNELRVLTDVLRGQKDNLAGLIEDSSTVLGELGSREAALRAIVGSGRTTLDSVAANTKSLDAGLAELPRLLEAARGTLAGSRPLLREAGPLVRELRRAAPELAPVLADLPAVTADSVDVISGLSGIPSMRQLLEVVNLVEPAVPGIEAAVRNLIPVLAYGAPRVRSLAAMFANFVSVNAHGDSLGRWARFAILFEPGEFNDVPTPAVCEPEDDIPVNAGLCHNAYPGPDDPLDNEPYEPGSYERLKPFDPPGD